MADHTDLVRAKQLYNSLLPGPHYDSTPFTNETALEHLTDVYGPNLDIRIICPYAPKRYFMYSIARYRSSVYMDSDNAHGYGTSWEEAIKMMLEKTSGVKE